LTHLIQWDFSNFFWHGTNHLQKSQVFLLSMLDLTFLEQNWWRCQLSSMTPCRLIYGPQCFRGACCPQHVHNLPTDHYQYFFPQDTSHKAPMKSCALWGVVVSYWKNAYCCSSSVSCSKYGKFIFCVYHL